MLSLLCLHHLTYNSRVLVPSTPQWGNLARQITLGEVLVSGKLT